MRVLLVDDEKTMRVLLADLLKKEGFDIDEAGDGEEGVRLALANPPDLVVSDIMMPHLDGWGMFQVMRILPSTKTTPFLFLTHIDEASVEVRAKKMGADEYVTKPFRLESLLEKINQLASRVQVRDKVVQGEEHTVEDDPAMNILVDTIEYLRVTVRTGVVSVTSGKQKGILVIEKGVPMHAAIGSSRGEEALVAMLGLRDSNVAFKEGVAPSLPKNFNRKWDDFMRRYVFPDEVDD
jgi:DNA-binding response OmpR family regulator